MMPGEGTARLRELKHRAFLAQKVLRQASLTARRHLAPSRRALAGHLSATMTVPEVRARARRSGSVWGVMLVRDEADILPRQLAHCAAQGLDGMVIADNLSTDGTQAVLAAYAGSLEFVVVRDAEPGHFQAEKTDVLAGIARRCGADWVVPMDADEFWFGATATLAEELRRSPNKVEVALVHPVVLDTRSGDFLVASQPDRLQKAAFRAHPWAHLHVGNHGVDRPGRIGHSLRVLHWAYRSPEHLVRKVRNGSRALDLVGPRDPAGGHSWRDLDRLTDTELESVYDEMLHGRGPWFMDWVPRGEMSPVEALPPTSWSRVTGVRS